MDFKSFLFSPWQQRYVTIQERQRLRQQSCECYEAGVRQELMTWMLIAPRVNMDPNIALKIAKYVAADRQWHPPLYRVAIQTADDFGVWWFLAHLCGVALAALALKLWAWL